MENSNNLNFNVSSIGLKSCMREHMAIPQNGRTSASFSGIDINIKLVNNLFVNGVEYKMYNISINNKIYYLNIEASKNINYVKLYFMKKNYLFNINENTFTETYVGPQKYILSITKICKSKFNPIDLTGAKEKINELNNLLKNIDSNISIHIDYPYDIIHRINKIVTFSKIDKKPTILLLYLYRKNKGCVSSIEIEYDSNGDIYINSQTHSKFRGYKYNKLLRISLAIISPYLVQPINEQCHIISIGIDPISCYSMINIFGALYDKQFEQYLCNNNINNITFNIIKTYLNLPIKIRLKYGYSSDIKTIIKINEKMIQYAEQIFNSTLLHIHNPDYKI